MSQKTIFALVDINNCYVSIQQLFDPKLNGRIVCVLSNNDGCIVARSKEAKLAGIKMGMPRFQLENMIKEDHLDVVMISSNYPLYADMSRRFHNILANSVGEESATVYSIDEAFLDLTSLSENYDLITYASELKDKIQKHIGLPVCIGIGHSYTEAKMSNFIAKKNDQYNGIFSLVGSDSTALKEKYYKTIDVSEVWGVGRQYAKKLAALGIYTVQDLTNANEQTIQTVFGIVLRRTVKELNCIPSIKIDQDDNSRQQIVVSRTFGQRITDLDSMLGAIAEYTQIAHKRMRKDNMICGCITVYASSSRFDTKHPYVSDTLTFGLEMATDDVRVMIQKATTAMAKIFKQDVRYNRCGITLTALSSVNDRNQSLFDDPAEDKKTEDLMQALESIQSKFGKAMLGFGTANLKNQAWETKASLKTQNYCSLNEILVIDDSHMKKAKKQQ